MLSNDIQRPWLDRYDPQVPPHLEYETIPLFAYLDRAAARYPQRPALVFQNLRLGYAQLKEQAETVAANLQRLGVGKGDRVAIMLPNLPQTVIAYWGVLKAGAVVVMTNPLYMEKELVHHITDSGSRVMITLDRLWPKISSLWSKLELDTVITTSVGDGLRFPLNILYPLKARREKTAVSVPHDGKSVLPWKALTRRKAPFAPVEIDPRKDLAVLQYTGGTTGLAKGVMLGHDNLGANVQQCSAVLHTIGDEPEVFLGLLPFFHVYGLTVCINFATALAATVSPYPQFVPQEVLKAIDKVKPTIFPSAPAVFNALLQQKNIRDFDLRSIRYCVTGSAPMLVELAKQFKDLTGAEIIEGFGLTETSPVTHLNPLRGKRKTGSIGLPFPDTDVSIVDTEMGVEHLPPGRSGELIIRGPQVMHGYWGRPDETAQTLRGGWLYTGDIAYMDEEGYFFIVDRKKDLIISGGYNIYPREIDEVLYEHPKVADAVCVGVPHKTRGEIVKAYIVPKPGQELDKKEVLGFCRQKLANFKVPKKVEFREELPKTVVGKVLRRALKEEVEAEDRG
ncbi:long-chain-fatty-acid--CoA ligase [Desulfovermiculus halophilus]|uniref:long-chain-fatty-acid--CoA ligase n=1 Tax=Desulfovermiculus halophilus TaxID=339722 RepID=UPI0004895BFF|nr:long-chain fatty acid--CoA ligase [Desulfovermiculus halophilus]